MKKKSKCSYHIFTFHLHKHFIYRCFHVLCFFYLFIFRVYVLFLVLASVCLLWIVNNLFALFTKSTHSLPYSYFPSLSQIFLRTFYFYYNFFKRYSFFSSSLSFTFAGAQRNIIELYHFSVLYFHFHEELSHFSSSIACGEQNNTHSLTRIFLFITFLTCYSLSFPPSVHLRGSTKKHQRTISFSHRRVFSAPLRSVTFSVLHRVWIKSKTKTQLAKNSFMKCLSFQSIFASKFVIFYMVVTGRKTFRRM